MKKFLNFIKRLFKKLSDRTNIIIFIIVMIVMYSPVIVGYAMYFLTGNKWHTSYATAWIALWALPATPFFPICIGITFGIRKIIDRFFKGKGKKDGD